MTVAAFLSHLADSLEGPPVGMLERRAWAMRCRDYATISNISEHLEARPTPGRPVPAAKTEAKARKLATTKVDKRDCVKLSR